MSFNEDIDQHINIVYEVEKLAMKITQLKSQNIALDRQRQQNSEALRAIYNKKNEESFDSDTVWLKSSGTFINVNVDLAETFLKQEQLQIEKKIHLANNEMKQLVKDLQLVAPSKGVDPKSLELLLR